MTASTIDRGQAREYPFGPIRVGVEGDAVIPCGVLVSKPLDGYARNGTALASHIVLGMSLHAVDATGKEDGDRTIDVRPGKTGPWVDGDAGIGHEDIGAMAYLVDNQTLSLSDANGTRPKAGVIWDVVLDGGGIGVYIDVEWSDGATTLANATARIQAGSGTLVAGVATINTGITVTAGSKVLASRKTEGGTDGDEIRCAAADRTVGAPGVGSLTFRAFTAGAPATSDTSTFDFIIVG